MNFWVCAAGMYTATAILGKVHTAFLNYNYFSKMINMPDEIVIARIMAALDLEFERALHYCNERYDSDNDYDLPVLFMRPLCIYLVSTTQTFLNLMDYKGAQCPTSPSTPR